MPNVTRQITLTEQGSNSGPFYDAYYSLDGASYTICTDGNGIVLNGVGSTVNVTLPDTSQYLKLVNLSVGCNENDVIEFLGQTTTTSTTSTTSTTTSTSSTTTTIAPTTSTTSTSTTSTTTTLAPKFWNAIYCSDGSAVGVALKMAGTATTGSVVEAGTGVGTCASLSTVYVGTPIVFFDKTASTIYANCAACGITTTTTSTTTPAPVWYNLYNCSNGNTETSAQYPDGTFSINQRVAYSGALFFYVISKVYSNPGGIQWSIASAGAGLTGCPATTTTSTTTTLAPITLTVAGSCVGGYGTGEILANNFAGSTGTYEFIAIGTSEANAIAAVDDPGQRVFLNGSLSHTFQNLINSNYWVALKDSTDRKGISAMTAISCGTTTSTTSTSTTTSTTTLQPGYYRALNCADLVTHIFSTLSPSPLFNSGDRITANGGQNYVVDGFQTNNPGGTLYTFTATGLFGCPATTTTSTTAAPALTVTNGAVTCSGNTGGWRSSFTGGSGTYTNVAYGTSQANAQDWLDGSGSGPGAMVTLGGGATFHDWSGIANGTWYVAVKDSTPADSVQNTPVTVNCTTTSTTTIPPTTTTTSTTRPQVWYTLYNCSTGETQTSTNYLEDTFSINQRVQYGTGGSILSFYVLSQVYSNPGGIQWSVASAGGGLTLCPATTTTSTTTTLSPVNFTFTTSCSGGLGVITITSITGGTGTGYQFSIDYGANWYNYPANTQISGLGNGSYTIIVRDSVGAGTNQPTSINCATTTSTTTTEAPCQCYQATNTTGGQLTITYTACGDESSSTVPLNGYATLNFCVQPGTLIFRDAGISNPTLCGVTCVYDGVDCSSCGGGPTTTTTTAGPVLYQFWYADVYPCNDCGGSTETILVAFDVNQTVIPNRFYIAQGGPDGNSYRITSEADAGIAYLLSTVWGSFTTCTLACGA